MTLPQGMNCRGDASYITDTGDNDYADYNNIGSTTYPQVTAQGNTYGSENLAPDQANRDSGTDERLAGIVYTDSTTPRLRFDLPSAGTYSIGFAAGDFSFGNRTEWDVYDTTTSLGSITTGSESANNFKDANNVSRSNADWVANNTTRDFTFSTTIFRLAPAPSSGYSVLAHFWIDTAGGGASAFEAGVVTVTCDAQSADYVAIINSTFEAGVVTLTANAQDGDFVVTSDPYFTVGPIYDAQGNLRNNETGITVHIYDDDTASPSLVVTLTSQTTNASGVMTCQSVSLTSTNSYRPRIILDDGTDDLRTKIAT